MTTIQSGVAYLTMFDMADGALTDGVQFSGVLVAPDEVLTAAHCVTDAKGGQRNYGDAYFGYAGDPAGAEDVRVTGVHVLDGTHVGPESDAQVATDFALVHLSRAVTDAQVFALGIGTGGGDVTVDGYPASAGGKLVEGSERVNPTGTTGETTGANVVPGGDGRGASGGPVWTTVGGTPTVVGLVSAQSSAGAMMFKALTGADVAQIQAWVAGDHPTTVVASSAPPVVATPAAVVPTPVTATPVATAPAPSPAVHADGLDRLAAALERGASVASGLRSEVLGDVATAVGIVRGEGATASDLPGAAAMLAATLRDTSWVPERAVGFATGLMAAEAGARPGHLAAYAAGVLGVDLASSTSRGAARAGYAADATYGTAGWSDATIGGGRADLAAMVATHGRDWA